MQLKAFALTLLLSAAPTTAFAQGKARPLAVRVQLAEISVQSPRSRRTDTLYAALSVQAGSAAPRTLTRRLGDVGRGTKAIALSAVVAVAPEARLGITWAVVNDGRERTDALLTALGRATEDHVTDEDGGETWLALLLKRVPVAEDRSERCDGPVLAGRVAIPSAELARELKSGASVRITRRQRGLDAPTRCAPRSDYFVTLVITRAPTPPAGPRRPRPAS